MKMDNQIRVAMIVTRSLEVDAAISRVRIMREIQGALSAEATVELYRIRTLPEIRRVRSWFHASVLFARQALLGDPIPLQCLLYADRCEVLNIVRGILGGHYDAVYIDSVRSVAIVRELRKRAPTLRITVDFDDLMSRRMELIANNGWPIQLGHVGKFIPTVIRRRIEGRWSRVVARFESASLRRVEDEICNLVQSIVLISPWEAELLRRRAAKDNLRIAGILPAQRAVGQSKFDNKSFRFVFVGSDTNGQNRQSIEYLLMLWSRAPHSADLHIYGRQQGKYGEIRNVFWHGYVKDLADVYTEDSILILPVFRAGGIKTKLLEAWANGRPALVNLLAMEGIEMDSYPLVVPESEWESYIANPSAYADLWAQGAQLGLKFVKEKANPTLFAVSWRNIVIGR